ncbi:MAG: hypothetical protein A2748_01475 [Candidatus Wildermuthbacteria bacterium RIFCSPHIGHO2_01_FULL_45_20]|uniref:Uncharacterized protein n=1 Tax=Candidatus Wildermuthbacteria bacterium RIFCSPHIGHO2_02_FULL_45_25 TaxID=1802450 RepID=A0A1G2R216_9BACT|nr:MAG: hypothetical protein A2748_01475 [Candidatus Wildermuthbacteria bacterium RIFCSPHIGHO2_01_FULL_45_20]OHA66880.1 MAG: hypothetical protein A3C04_02460 [Candidatus Wildermuthbacteria bacterium RIFCSPHIGHO2_02_FULL_45_25]
MKLFNYLPRRGSAIYIALIAMGIIFAIGIGLGTLFLGGFNIAQSAGESVIAFYAADAGFETLFAAEKCFNQYAEGGNRDSCIKDVLRLDSSFHCNGSDTAEKIACLQGAMQEHESAGKNQLANGAIYTICNTLSCSIVGAGGDCSAGASYCATSKGIYTGAHGNTSQRAIRISR